MAGDTRGRMLEAAARLLQHRGYHGVSLTEVLEESNAPRGSLYYHFPGGKDQLVLEATRMAVDEATHALRGTLASGATPGRGVRAFIETAAEVLIETDFTFGCPVAPVILDGAAGLEELERLCREAFEEWLELLRDAFTRAGMPASRALSLALLVEASVEGLLLIARAQRNVGPLRKVAAELETVVDAAVPTAARG